MKRMIAILMLSVLWACQPPAAAPTAVSAVQNVTKPAARRAALQSSAPSTAPRLVYAWWDWNTTADQIDALVPPLAGRFDGLILMCVGPRARVEASIVHVLSIPHPPLTVGLSTAELLTDLEDVAGWAEMGRIGAWATARTGVKQLVLDLEWDAGPFLYQGVPLDFAPLRAGLREFATRNYGTAVLVYPPNYESAATVANLHAVVRRTALLDLAHECLPNMRAIGATACTYATWQNHPFGDDYRRLELFWSQSPGAAEQMYVMTDAQWTPAQLRAALPTIGRTCLLYVEPPYTVATAERLLACLPAAP
jgi:hypothetical protein